MTTVPQKCTGADARDEAFADLVAMESRRRHLEGQARSGDKDAARQLSALRPQLSKQAVVAADLDRARDLGDGWHASNPATEHAGRANRLRELCTERLALARGIEAHVDAVVALCHRMSEIADGCMGEAVDMAPIAAELGRFREQFCFYLESKFDFMTGAKGIAGHPSYRKLAEVMLDGEAILKLYRRSAGACGDSAVGHRDVHAIG